MVIIGYFGRLIWELKRPPIATATLCGKDHISLRHGYSICLILLLSAFMLSIPSGPAVRGIGPDVFHANSGLVDTSSYHANIRVLDNSSGHMISKMPLYSTESSLEGNGLILLRGQDVKTQASLSPTRATQTNNIVDARSYYDIMIRTGTAGVIKSIEFNFPPGTYVGSALLVEAVGIGPGKVAATGSTGTGMKIIYTVTNAANVPAFTNIRIQLANINNPSIPSNSLTVTTITKNAAGSTIDGPTATQAYSIKPIGSTGIADNAITSSKIADHSITSNDLDERLIFSRLLQDNSQGASFGWNPNGIDNDFIIFDDAIQSSNAVLINVGDSSSNSQCESLGSLAGFFTIRCNIAPPQGSELRYNVVNIPFS